MSITAIAAESGPNNMLSSPVSSASLSVDEIFSLFNRHGSGDYVGEAVSQLQHGLQAASQARASGAKDAVIAAALLHDVGHMIGLSFPERYTRMGDCGTFGHEGIGGSWLDSLGFDPLVGTLVRRHVDAKRYLCAVNLEYEKTLSSASRTTLGHQGGPMSSDEVNAFSQDPLKDTIILMRSWDEAAKDPHAIVSPLEAYRGLFISLIV